MDPKWIRYVILLTKTGKPMKKEWLVGHIEHLRSLQRKGQLELCGPFQDYEGGMVIVKSSSKDEARRMAEADPFVENGFDTYELRTWELSCEENDHLGAGKLTLDA